MYVAVSVVADRQTHRSTTITLAHVLRVKQHTPLNLEQMLHTEKFVLTEASWVYLFPYE